MKKSVLRLLDAILAAILVTLIVWLGFLNELDNNASDWLYQKSQPASQDIVIIGIDPKTFDELGRFYTWARTGFAQVIDNLNQDPANRPAVIGIDVLFTGEDSEDPAGDQKLAEAFARYNNVVIASEAAADVDDEDFENATWFWDRSFPAVSAGTDTGNIWGPDDDDGIIRHSMLYVNVRENDQKRKLFSFPRVIYEKYCRQMNIEPNPFPNRDDKNIFYIPYSTTKYNDDISFFDVYEGKIPAETFRDKIVLIGIRSSGMGDNFRISLDHAPVFGIEVHANEIQAYQQNFFPLEADKNLQLVILFLVAAVAEYFFRTSEIKTAAIIWFGICAGWFLICYVGCFYFEVILHALWIPALITVLFIGAIGTDYVRVQVEKLRVTTIFGQYFDPIVMNQLIAENSSALRLGGEMHDIVVLFVDIRGFTTMSEKLSPSAVVDILNRYLTLTTACIRKYHGTLDKFIGDCTMAFWNAPIEQENPELLACKAAIDMVEGSKKLIEDLKKDYDINIAFGIGIHCGKAVVGNIGSPIRMDYTAIGDTVNTAERIEANSPGGTILISREMKNRLGDSADVTERGTLKLKGKAHEFEIFQLNFLK